MDEPGNPKEKSHLFVKTDWKTVLAARDGAGAEAEKAWEALCRDYWKPIYTYLRCFGNSHEEAEDLTQGFLARLIERNSLKKVNRSRGKFRTFLLWNLKSYASEEWRKVCALKRGGGKMPISLDDTEAEKFQLKEQSSQGTPDLEFEREWGMTILRRALAELRADFASRGKGSQFETLRPCLGGRGEVCYTVMATEMGMTKGTVTVMAHRFRRDFIVLLKELVAKTVTSKAEQLEEVRWLLRLLNDYDLEN